MARVVIELPLRKPIPKARVITRLPARSLATNSHGKAPFHMEVAMYRAVTIALASAFLILAPTELLARGGGGGHGGGGGGGHGGGGGGGHGGGGHGGGYGGGHAGFSGGHGGGFGGGRAGFSGGHAGHMHAAPAGRAGF